jgi:hypothetical protein
VKGPGVPLVPTHRLPKVVLVALMLLPALSSLAAALPPGSDLAFASRGFIGGTVGYDVGPPCNFVLGNGIADVEGRVAKGTLDLAIVAQVPQCAAAALGVCSGAFDGTGARGTCSGGGSFSLSGLRRNSFLGAGPVEQVHFQLTLTLSGLCSVACRLSAAGPNFTGFAVP